MLCILIFIIFLIFFPILGIFPKYRAFFKQSWQCVWKKIRLKPCDIDLGEQIKNKTVSWLLFKSPVIARFVEKTFSLWAVLFVLLNVFSLVYTLNAGLNLFVYDTCSPTSTEGCALSGDSCEVGIDSLSFQDALNNGQLVNWSIQPFKQFGDTLSRIPDRLKTWNGDDFIDESASFYSQNENNQTALEIIDPGCPSCKKLYKNIKESNFTENYNLTYILYPIPSSSTQNGYRFKNSHVLSKYIIALQDFDTDKINNPDWLFIDYIFTKEYKKGFDVQFMFSYSFDSDSKEVFDTIHEILKDIGYDDEEIEKIDQKAQSQEVKDKIGDYKKTVENEIRTIKIPTIIFDGRRFDRVVSREELNK